MEKREAIRRACFIEKKSIRAVAREFSCCSRTVNKAIASSEAQSYTLSRPRKAPVLGPYKTQIDGMLEENQKLPKKQRYTSRRIYEIICEAGYEGSESTVRGYVSQQRKRHKKRKVYLPLEFDPGRDAQADWGEGMVIMNGETLASGSDDGTVRLWRASDGEALAVLEDHTGWVLSVAWSPDGETLASGSDDGTVRLWSADGEALAVLEGHTDMIISMAWSPDGETLASGSDDGTVRLWRASDGEALAVLEGHTSGSTR